MYNEKMMSQFKKQGEERNKYVKKIIESTHPKKIIVSGPGTGKTYTFNELLKRKQGECLALTFINDLVEKLEIDLKGKAKCRTFHGYCKGLLHRINCEGINDNFIFFPKLELIIKSDAQIIYNKNPNFGRSFKKLDYSSRNIPFFLERSSYYNAVFFDDSVYRVLEYFKENPDKIPKYEQIVVDEYQDFNRLEVELINILEERSPILIVGDDDQALYTQLRYASPDFIRERFNDPSYEKFQLPFCSRSPKVIIEALDDIVSRAKGSSKLARRIDKKYICYLPEKFADSEKYSEIIHAHCSVQQQNAPYVAKFIEQEIDKLAEEEIREVNSKGDYTILIAGPKRYLKQINAYLKRRRKYILHYRKLDTESKTIKILEGYKIFLEDKYSNLGWRILLECDPIRNIKRLLEKTIEDSKIPIYKYLPRSYIDKHEVNLEILEKLKIGIQVAQDQKRTLEDFLKIKTKDLKIELNKDGQDEKRDKERVSSIDDVSVGLVTYVGCKGLSAGYVFIVGLNERNLPKNNKNPTDIEICKFIVAIARTIKKCYLVSNSRFAGKAEGYSSVFIDWIDKKRIEYQKIDAKYWKERKF